MLGALGGAGVAVALGAPRRSAADAIAGEIYYTRFSGTPNLKKVNFHFDGESLRFKARTAIARLEGADGLIFAPDGDLIVGGQGDRVHKVKADGSGAHTTRAAGGQASFHVTLDPRGDRVWTSGQPGALVETPLAPFGDGTARPLRGDDAAITAIGFDDRGTAYYTSSDFRGGGSFGIIDLATFTTRRLMGDILAAHSITFDSFSGDLFLFGGDEIVQIAPTSPRTLKSTKRFALTGHFDQGTTDGRGHLFVAHNTGRVVFIDYASTGRVGDEDNVVAIAFLDSNLDDVAPMSGPGAKPDPPPPKPAPEDTPPPPEPPAAAADAPPAAGGEGAGIGVPEAVAAAAAAALAAVLAWTGYLVLGRQRRAQGGPPGAGPPPPAAWREDWSEARALVDRLAEGGIDDLAAYLQGDPSAARAAAAAVKVLGDETSPSSREPGGAAAALQRAASRYPEDPHLARFNEILTAFAGGSQRVASRIAATDDEGPVRVVHSIAEPAKESWARVDVTAAAERDESPDEGDEKALQAVERAVSGLLVGADPRALAERLLAEVTTATDSTLAYVAEANAGRGGEVDFEAPVAVAGATDPAAAAALGAEVARRFKSEGIGGGSIFGETDAGPFVAVPLRTNGAVVGMLALAGRAAGYEAHAPAILGPAAAVLAAAIAGDHDRDARIEAAVRSLEEAVAEVGGAAAGQELARLTAAASGEVRAVQVDLSALAGEIAADLSKDAPGRAVRFDIAEGVSARGDPRLLRMALEGLLGNAWAATAANARTEIGFGAGEEGEQRTFFVHDNRADFTAGPPEEDGVSLGRLYDTGAVAGAEVALATVQRVIDRHGGRARARGRSGQGARFDFTLPAAGGESARAAPATWRMIPTKRR